jgi:hypothetical protein
LTVGYLLHWRAGSLAYFEPIYLMSWHVICLSLIVRPCAGDVLRDGVAAFLTCGIILLIAVYPVRQTSAGNEGLHALALADRARAFDFQLSELRTKYTVVSDEFHFFKRRFDCGDVVDMGDYAWLFAQSGLLGEAYSQTVKRYMADVESRRPDIVIIGPVSAAPLHALVEHGHQCVLCGVAFYPSTPNAFSLYARDDLPIEELRAQFSWFKMPAPPAGSK